MAGPEAFFPHAHQFRVRYADTDMMGVVYYANYLKFFEIGRVEYLRACEADYRSIEDAGMISAVTAAQVRYHATATFDDLLTIRIRVPELGKVRFRFEYEIWRQADGTLIVTGSTEHVLLTRPALRPVRVPDHLRSRIERFESAHKPPLAAAENEQTVGLEAARSPF